MIYACFAGFEFLCPVFCAVRDEFEPVAVFWSHSEDQLFLSTSFGMPRAEPLPPVSRRLDSYCEI